LYCFFVIIFEILIKRIVLFLLLKIGTFMRILKIMIICAVAQFVYIIYSAAGGSAHITSAPVQISSPSVAGLPVGGVKTEETSANDTINKLKNLLQSLKAGETPNGTALWDFLTGAPIQMWTDAMIAIGKKMMSEGADQEQFVQLLKKVMDDAVILMKAKNVYVDDAAVASTYDEIMHGIGIVAAVSPAIEKTRQNLIVQLSFLSQGMDERGDRTWEGDELNPQRDLVEKIKLLASALVKSGAISIDQAKKAIDTALLNAIKQAQYTNVGFDREKIKALRAEFYRALV
jgi:hypothetical protein